MKNSSLRSSTIVIEGELKDKLTMLSTEEQIELVNNNTELVTASDGTEILTLLLEVENGEIVSKLDAEQSEKVRIADRQLELFNENANDKHFKKNIYKQTREILKSQRDELLKQGKTAILRPNNTMKIYDMPVYEYWTYRLSGINLIVGYIAISALDRAVTLDRAIGVALTLSSLFLVTLQFSTLYRVLMEREPVKEDESNENK